MEETKVGKLAVWGHAAVGQAWARVVHCHGLGEHSARHKNTIDFLTGHGVEVIRFDFRGTGKSEGERQWIDGFQDYIEDAVAVFRWSRSARPALPTFLMGHSLGGTIALHTAPVLGDTMRGLVVNAPAFEVGEGVSKVKIAVGRLLNKLTPHLRIPSALDLTALSRDPGIAKAYTADPLCCTFSTVRQGNAILNALDEIPTVCRQIKAPVLITHGEKDRLVLVNGSPKILEALASTDKTFEVFQGGFHEIHNDLCKDAYFALVLAWLKAHVG